jgi:DNA-binding transcriptional LysR family regulator
MINTTLDLKKLMAFQLVAKNGNLRLAAARLNQTIPAISSKIRKLEEDLGIKLFERLPNSLALTEIGERFLIEAEVILGRVDEAIATIETLESPRGRLAVSIGSDHSWYFAPKISEFLRRFPSVILSLQVYHATDAIQALNCGDLDVAIGIFPKLSKAFEREVVVETSLSLVCPAGHMLLRRQPPNLSDIALHRLIVLPKHAETRKLVDRGMKQKSIKPRSIIEVANCQMAGTFVELGVGIAIAHSLCVDHAHAAGLRWIDLSQHFGNIDFSIVCRKGARSNQLINSLIHELVK